MNRLQKKCAIATAGIHLLLLLVLIFGSAFFSPRTKPDDTQLLDVIPANLIDAAFNSGVKNAAPPAPTPIVTPPTPAIQPTPPPPVPKPVEPPPPTIAERLENIFTPKPVKPPPTVTPVETKHQIQVNTQPVTRNTPKNTAQKNPVPDDSQRKAQAISSAIQRLKQNLSPGTTIDMPGDSTVAYANYASVVKSVYDRAWTLPDTIANDENITVTVTIASDGTVISSRIIMRSGDSPADASVQRTLDRVTFVAAFREGSSDKQRTYTINFNPQLKKSE
jgi:TonB family protein